MRRVRTRDVYRRRGRIRATRVTFLSSEFGEATVERSARGERSHRRRRTNSLNLSRFLTFGRDDDDGGGGGDGVGELDRWWRRFVIDDDARLSDGFGFRRFARLPSRLSSERHSRSRASIGECNVCYI